MSTGTRTIAIFVDLKERLCPVTDLAFSALLDDLEAARDAGRDAGRVDRRDGPDAARGPVGGRRRGGWQATAATTGRTCFTSVLAGGGIRGGVVYGSSDRYAAYPASLPTKPADLAATVYHCLGVDPQMTIADRLKRPQTLCEGEVIRGILE